MLNTDSDLTSLTANVHQQPIMVNGNGKYLLNTNSLQRKPDDDEYTPVTLSAPKGIENRLFMICVKILSLFLSRKQQKKTQNSPSF